MVVSDSVWPVVQQPPKASQSLDSPGKVLLDGYPRSFSQWVKVKSEVKWLSSCQALSDPMDYSLQALVQQEFSKQSTGGTEFTHHQRLKDTIWERRLVGMRLHSGSVVSLPANAGLTIHSLLEEIHEAHVHKY